MSGNVSGFFGAISSKVRLLPRLECATTASEYTPGEAVLSLPVTKAFLDTNWCSMVRNEILSLASFDWT